MTTNTRTITSGLSVIGICTTLALAVGCSKSEPQARNNEPRPTPPKVEAPGDTTKTFTIAPPAVADALTLDVPEFKLPSQDEVDALITGKINTGNADAEFAELVKDIDGDSG